MSVLQARPKGTPTVALTLRIDAEAHKRLRQYALYSEKTMSLAADELIFKATEELHGGKQHTGDGGQVVRK
ncbi:MAG: hypothetical protein FWB91_00345 [Defluviitaleaceae bacterium]|nr:hypothetical protein [Defluviitaleaceae bacterium]